jgi:serine/threonine protein kinase/tetratricopeptide (TPR) repeat protein
MTGQSANGPGKPADVNDLVALVLERIESEGSVVVDRVCEEHPALAEALRRRLSHLRQFGLLDDRTDLEPDRIPERLGPFKLEHLLGGGGMGVVYLAEQEGLGRKVALKLIKPEHLYFPGARARFKREIETIAKLQHPGIVPIFTVGEESGIPYFTMERVAGCTLHDALVLLRGRDLTELTGVDLKRAILEASHEEIPLTIEPGYVFAGTYEEAVLRLVRQVADALEHAHRKGILHRDVKPSNVMVTGDGRAMLLDFGLAIHGESDRFTKAGHHFGSVPYMPPEQARGDLDAIDGRSDIYSLGVSLYEMLTLDLPYRGDSNEETLQRIFEGRPSSPRRRNPAVTWETETLCLTAMDVERSRRYPTMDDLARDVENVLAHRPIEARRVGFVRRVTTWMRRRPAEATSVALALVLVVGVPFAAFLREKDARERIGRERERAERNFEQALAAVDALQREVGEVDLRYVPQMESVRRRLLERASTFYEQFLAQSGDDPHLLWQQARVFAGVGEIRRSLGDLDAAARAYDEEIAILERLRALDATDRRLPRDLAIAYRNRGLPERLRGHVAEASRLLDRAVALHAEIERSGTMTRDDRRAYAETLYSYGTLLLGSDSERSRTSLEGALEQQQRSGAFAEGASPPASIEERTQRASILNMLASSLADVGRVDDSIAAYRDAIDELERLRSELDQRPDVKFELAGVQLNLGTMLDMQRPQLAEREYLRALTLLRELVRDFPSTPDYRLDLGNVFLNLEQLYGFLKRPDDARHASDEGFTILEALVREHPTNDYYANAFAKLCSNRVGLLQAEGDVDGALAVGEIAIQTRRAMAARRPDSAETISGLGGALHNFARAVRTSGDHERAYALVEEAVRVQREARRLAPSHPTVKRFLRFHFWSMIEMDHDARDDVAATTHVDELIDVDREDSETWRIAATVLSRGAALARDDATLDATTRQRWFEERLARARECFKEAVAHGLDDASRLDDRDLDALRADPAASALFDAVRQAAAAKPRQP